MIHHELFLITGPCEGLHSSKLNSANWIIKKYRKLHIRVFLFASFKSSSSNCLRAKRQLFWNHCRQLSWSATSQRVKSKICVQKENKTDYYYLSNRRMIEVVFSSRVSLLAFYSSEKVLSAQVCSLACVSITVLWPKTRIKLVLQTR